MADDYTNSPSRSRAIVATGGYACATVGDPQAADVIENFRQLCPQLSPECREVTLLTCGLGSPVTLTKWPRPLHLNLRKSRHL